jgi:hypothetical protein
VELCKRINAQNVKVHLDVYHMNIEKTDIREASRVLLGSRFRGYSGFGAINGRIAETWHLTRCSTPRFNSRRHKRRTVR